MQNRNLTVVTAFVVAALALGCNSNPTAPRQPDQASGLDSVTAEARGGNGGGGGGGGGGGATTLMDVAMAGGMIAVSQAVPVQNDNNKELNLQGEMTGVFTALGGTSAGSGACIVMDGDPGADHSALLSLLETGPLNPFRVVVVIDKGAIDAVSDKHRVTLNWDNPDPDGGSLIVNLTEDVKVEQSGSTYTFSGGYVRIQDKRGRKDSVLLKCPNGGDTVAVTIGS